LGGERNMEPQIVSNLLQTLLYEKRFGPFFVEPVIAGLDKNNKPYICATDLIGAPGPADDFVVSGTASEQLFGVCETLYQPDLVRIFKQEFVKILRGALEC
jgi:20S proteasome subunit beta 3